MRKLEFSNVEKITFGIEIETIIPSNANVDIGPYHRGNDIYTAPSFNGKYWKAERDGSIRNSHGTKQCEFISPILQGAAGIQNVIDMIDYLDSIGAQVNRSCGLHIHIGLQSLVALNEPHKLAEYVAKLGAVANINTEAVYAQTGTRRDNNGYCLPLDNTERVTLKRVKQQGDCTLIFRNLNRYKMLNFQNINRFGTVEFRAFAGTTNINKILHHLWTCMFITKFASELTNVPWTGRGWHSENGGIGEQSLRGLHRKMGKKCLVGEMVNRVKDMKSIALKMAQKYDTRVA